MKQIENILVYMDISKNIGYRCRVTYYYIFVFAQYISRNIKYVKNKYKQKKVYIGTVLIITKANKQLKKKVT